MAGRVLFTVYYIKLMNLVSNLEKICSFTLIHDKMQGSLMGFLFNLKEGKRKLSSVTSPILYHDVHTVSNCPVDFISFLINYLRHM